jgi:hypothetical protein
MAGDEIAQLNSSHVAKASSPNETTPDSFQQLFKFIMFEKTEHLRRQSLNEIKKSTQTQAEIQFLSSLRQVFLFGYNDDGSFTVNEKLKNILKKVANPGSENLMEILSEMGLNFTATYQEESFNGLFSDIEALNPEKAAAFQAHLEAVGITKGQKPTDQQLAKLVETIGKPEHLELRKLIVNRDILGTKTTFTKAERENFVESARSAIDQKNVILEMLFERTHRLQTEIDHFQQYIATAGKIFNDMMKSCASKVGK